MNKYIIYISGTVAVLGLIIGVLYFVKEREPSFDYSEFATCLSEKGAKFYGAFWCPHCKEQKKMFGKGKDKIPYVECSTDDALGQLEECEKIKIESYPTWIFADGERKTGSLSLETLATKTGCELPKEIK